MRKCFSVYFILKPAAKRIKTLFFLMMVWSTKKEIRVWPDFLLCLFISLEQKESPCLAAHFLKSEKKKNKPTFTANCIELMNLWYHKSLIWSSVKERCETSPFRLQIPARETRKEPLCLPQGHGGTAKEGSTEMAVLLFGRNTCIIFFLIAPTYLLNIKYRNWATTC